MISIEDNRETRDDEDSEIEEEDDNLVNNIRLSEIRLPIDFDKDETNLLEKTEDVNLYTNLYPIKFTKDIEICEYPFTITPECHEESVILKILRQISPELFKQYGYYYRSGNSFFAVRKIKEKKIFKTLIVHKGMLEYTVIVEATPKSSIIEKGKTHNFTEIQERVLFLVIREILSANPNVHFDRDNLYLENVKQEVKGYSNTYYIHDGYKISIQQADIGICLIIGVKNKIKGEFTVLDFISNNDDEAIENLANRRFIPKEGSRSQVISYIDFDRNPEKSTRNYKQVTYNYIDYYDKIWKIKIKNKK